MPKDIWAQRCQLKFIKKYGWISTDLHIHTNVGHVLLKESSKLYSIYKGRLKNSYHDVISAVDDILPIGPKHCITDGKSV